MTYRNSYIFLCFIIMLLILLMGMKQMTATQRAEHRLHAQALARAQALMSHMKENPVAAQAGHYDSAQMQQIPICRPCDGREQAKVDLLNWQLANKMKLPHGHGQVAFSNGRYVITVRWKSKHRNPQCKLEGYNCINVSYTASESSAASRSSSLGI